MFFTSDDFRIKAENFDLSKGANILRIICGAFYVPAHRRKVCGRRSLGRHCRLLRQSRVSSRRGLGLNGGHR